MWQGEKFNLAISKANAALKHAGMKPIRNCNLDKFNKKNERNPEPHRHRTKERFP
jgi:hypothetical protein